MTRRSATAVALAIAAAGPAGVATAPARARVSVGVTPQRIVVRAPAARAIIDRRPFRIAFGRTAGGPVLREVRAPQRRALTIPPTIDPVPPGFDNQSTAALYAPLTFLAGRQTLRQYEGGLWGGNPRQGERAGTEYAARAVTGVRRIARGVRLRVSTSDPTGRRLEVRVTAQGAAAIRVSVRPHPAAGVASVGDSFASGRGEAFFGFGGRHNALDQRGRVLSSFVEEENVNGRTGLGKGGGGRWLFPNGPTAAYYPQALLYSSRPYGLWVDRSEPARFRLAADRPDAWRLSVAARGLDYVVAPGRAPRAIRTLTALTGRQPLPPRWALGPMLDRLVRNVGETRADYEAHVRADLRNIRRHRLPLTAYRIEGWGMPGGNDGLALHSFISPALQRRVIARLRARGIHPLAYLRPLLEPGSAPVRRGLAVRDAAGRPYYTTSTTGKPIALLDFTNPAAVRYWRREVTKVLDLGFDGFMADFGEEVLYDMRFAGGQTGRAMHNRYLVLYARATRRALRRYERRHRSRRLWFFNRAGYSGHPGSAAYEGGNFPGDETTDYTHSSGIASLTSDMLGRAVGGAYGFATDIGGYYDITTPPTTKELFLRWAQWAALSPIFRLHGSGLAGTHTPWSFDRQTVRVYRRLSRLHLRAAPLIMRLWRRARRTGMPVTRPLWLSAPDSGAARRADQEWLLGRDVLVAPVVRRGAHSRRVLFPRGCWRAPGSTRRHHGPSGARVSAPLTRLPWFIRCGTDPLQAARRVGQRPSITG